MALRARKYLQMKHEFCFTQQAIFRGESGGSQGHREALQRDLGPGRALRRAACFTLARFGKHETYTYAYT